MTAIVAVGTTSPLHSIALAPSRRCAVGSSRRTGSLSRSSITQQVSGLGAVVQHEVEAQAIQDHDLPSLVADLSVDLDAGERLRWSRVPRLTLMGPTPSTPSVIPATGLNASTWSTKRLSASGRGAWYASPSPPLPGCAVFGSCHQELFLRPHHSSPALPRNSGLFRQVCRKEALPNCDQSLRRAGATRPPVQSRSAPALRSLPRPDARRLDPARRPASPDSVPRHCRVSRPPVAS